MKKADYSILAQLIKNQLTARMTDKNRETSDALKTLARNFAQSAHVDKAAFLRACGIE